MRVEPVSEEVLVDRVVGLVLDRAAQSTGPAVRLAVDGHPATRPEALADALVTPLRAAGRPVGRLHARDFLRPRSLRLEHGHEDPDALLDAWIDVAGMNREALAAVGPDGTGSYLPSLRDPATDRATRATPVPAMPGLVLVLDGSLLLGRWLDLDLTVHLALRPATEARRTPPEERWTLPAYERYRDEVAPEDTADLVVRVDDPRHPAVVHR